MNVLEMTDLLHRAAEMEETMVIRLVNLIDDDIRTAQLPEATAKKLLSVLRGIVADSNRHLRIVQGLLRRQDGSNV